MTAHITAEPTIAKPGEVLAVDFWNCEGSTEKVMLTTVDAKGVESGWDVGTGLPTNINRPLPDGSMRVGIKAPPQVGPAKVRAYQLGKLVAECSVTVR